VAVRCHAGDVDVCSDGRLVVSSSSSRRAGVDADAVQSAVVLRQLRDGQHAVCRLRGRRQGCVPWRLRRSARLPRRRRPSPLDATRRRQLRQRLCPASQTRRLHACHQVRRLDPTTYLISHTSRDDSKQ